MGEEAKLDREENGAENGALGPQERVPGLPEPVLEEHYGALTWTDREADEMRRTRCLCRRCDHMHILPDGSHRADHCIFAAQFFVVCQAADAATFVTRCSYFRAKL
jgi:hypothetical protein